MRKKQKIIIAVTIVITVLAAFAGGCALGVQTRYPGLDVIDQAWNIIFQDYVDKSKLDETALSQAAVKALVETLNDPHTEYIDPETYLLTMTNFQGKFEGIGAQVGTKDKQIIVLAPMPGSPAENAGIRPGDAIMEIDGQSTADMSLEQAVQHIRGPKGTTVSLLVVHQGESTPVKIGVVRAEIDLTSVQTEMKGDIAYIRLIMFSDRTDEELTPVISGLAGSGARGIVLDLRTNPGGLLQEVVDVASHFINEGVIVKVVDNTGQETTTSVTSGEVTTDLPMVVLVDAYSASGSEVLSGALQDYGRATIAGTTTFGKGSVNILRQLPDGSGIYITTARWLTPKGRLIEGKGLEPDITLTTTGDEELQWALDYLHSKIGERTVGMPDMVLASSIELTSGVSDW